MWSGTRNAGNRIWLVFRHTLIDDDTDDEADHVLLYIIELF